MSVYGVVLFSLVDKSGLRRDVGYRALNRILKTNSTTVQQIGEISDLLDEKVSQKFLKRGFCQKFS